MPDQDVELFAASAAAYWTDLLRGGRAPSSMRDAEHSGLLGPMADMPRPASNAIDFFEDYLRGLLETQLRRCGTAHLRVDYHPEGLLAEAAGAALLRAFTFPFKTRMFVSAEEIVVSEGYRAPDRVLCTTKARAMRRAVNDLHWASSPWGKETRTDVEVDAWEARGQRIADLFSKATDTPVGDFDVLVRTAFECVNADGPPPWG